MTEPKTHCPLVGLAVDRTLMRSTADAAHRCYALQPPGSPDVYYQKGFCLATSHTQCPFFQNPDAPAGVAKANHAGLTAERVPPDEQRPRVKQWLPLAAWASLAIVAWLVGFVYLRDTGVVPALPLFHQVAQITLAPSPALSPPPSPASPAPAVTQTAGAPTRAAVATRDRYSTPTPEPGGRTITVASPNGEAGWWTRSEPAGNHLGDSFLYAGCTGGHSFISAVRFDLSSIPRGAPIRSAQLRLTGLREDRFVPASGGTWSVQVMPADSLPDYGRTDFYTLLNVQAAVSLSPTFFAADIGKARTNVATFDSWGRAWLEGQLREGKTSIIARIIGPGAGDSLFAWDSGAGPATGGEGPQLVLALGPAPATEPPLPTDAVLVATDTPTPANVLTAVVHALAATALTETGTPAYRFVTPTPTAANIATLQAHALAGDLLPIVPDTPTPATEETARMQRLAATAEAFLTGTPSLLSGPFVTPVIITPTPVPANVMTAASQALTATSMHPRGTPTAWAYNVIVATVTPPVFVIVDTPTPANEATATVYAAYATAVAMLTGTFTPFPYNAVTATCTATPTGTATPRAPAPAPAWTLTTRPSAASTAPAPTRAPLSATANVQLHRCSDPRVQITAPQAGGSVAQHLEIRGRAVHEAFIGYVIEFARGAQPAEGYEEVFRSEKPVDDGALGVFVLTGLPKGTYTVSLRVLTSAGDPPPPCRIVIEVRNP